MEPARRGELLRLGQPQASRWDWIVTVQ
jgi:hypothetical protein